IQRVLKHSMKHSAHCDIVKEAADQLLEDREDEVKEIRLESKVGLLRDRALGWLVKAYHDINNPELIKKAFQLCRVHDYDLSHECLTKLSTLRALTVLKITHPNLYAKLIDDNTY
ncbi:hypothetical protein F5890DRAFT_1393989, partial [Lentinula detonsa]